MSKLQAQPIEHISLADASDLGRMIFKARDEAGESVENLARRTRISQRLLVALEAGDLHKLPAPVYVRGYLKAIGTELDVDSSSWVAMLDDLTRETTATNDLAPRPPQGIRWSSFRDLFGGSVRISHVLAVLLAIIAFFLLYFALEGGAGSEDTDRANKEHPAQTFDTRPYEP
ncbi:MAG: hypothetical protein CMH54_14505 [Myxococcales bacterium]|nr:hypothetical protein [Myxococcales bacterium]